MLRKELFDDGALEDAPLTGRGPERDFMTNEKLVLGSKSKSEYQLWDATGLILPREKKGIPERSKSTYPNLYEDADSVSD